MTSLSRFVTLMSATSALLKWDAAERAERYRIYKKVVGVDADFALIGTREALDLLLEGLAAGIGEGTSTPPHLIPRLELSRFLA